MNQTILRRKSPTWLSSTLVWQVLFSIESIWFGISSLLGQTFRTNFLFWLNEPPFAYFMLLLGLFGFSVVFTKYRLAQVFFALGNTFLLSIIFIAYCQSIILVPTTGVYGIQLAGSMWLFFRLVIDYRIRLALKSFLL